MSKREKVVELLSSRYPDMRLKDAYGLADYLLENGLTVLPYKVGQTVYIPWRYGGQKGVATAEVEEIKLYDTNPEHSMFFIDMGSDNECFNQSFGGWRTEECIGRTVFLAREEAESFLKEGEDETDL